MTESDFIAITETPYVTALAKDYLLGKDIGINNPLVTDYDGLVKKAKSREFSAEKRILLVNALLEQYEKDGIELEKDSKVYKSIQSLKESNTFSFTTGQQIHILLGPLFFIYKIQSLLRHVKNFNKNKTYKAVPIFWMATEDYDLEEINYVKLYGETYRWGAEAGNAVGRIKCEGLPDLIERIEARADKTEENKQLFSLFRKHYLSNKTLAAATRSLLHELFEDSGLIIIDPDDKILKKGFTEIAKKEIEEKFLFHTYNEQNSILKKRGYEPRVNAQEINYFWLDDHQRIKLKIKNNTIIRSDIEKQLPLTHIIQNIEKLSPNVIARPLYQETVLPNVLYIGGNAEIEYWLPLQQAFNKLGVQFPALMQRDSGLIISKKNREVVQKTGLDWKELLKNEKELASCFFNKSSSKSETLSSMVELIKTKLNELKQELEHQEFKNTKPFKEINDLQKSLFQLGNLILDEQFKLQKEDHVFNKLLKIKSRYIDLRQERNEFVISYTQIINTEKLRSNEFKGLLNVTFY